MNIHRILIPAVSLLLVLALPISPVTASPRQGGPGHGPDGDPDREDLMETVEIYMMAKMKRYLELDDEQTKMVIPLVEELNSMRRTFRHERRGMIRHLQPLVDDPAGDPDDVSDLLKKLYALEQQHREAETRSIESIRDSLSPVQQARFMLFQEKFRREMEQRLRGVMGDRRGGPPPGRRPDQDGR